MVIGCCEGCCSFAYYGVMLYRRFGRTEIEMPVFSCGGMRYQQSWSDMPLGEVEAGNQANLEATIRRSVELGINHIETARGYGSSERQLGEVLPTFKRDKLIVQTKIAPKADAGEFVAEFRDSLKRLKLEYVDLLGIHGINTHEHLWWATKPKGCLAAARQLVKEGLVRHVGFSTHGTPALIRDAVNYKGADDHGFDYVNLHWYYIFQQNWGAIEDATKHDMGVFIISPSDKGGMLYRPPEKLKTLCHPLHPLVFNCVYCLSRPQVHTLSLGASCPEDFELQMSSLLLLGQADTILPPIEAVLEAAMEEAVGRELAHDFKKGLPQWDGAPGYINVLTILWLRNLALGWGMVEYAKMRYNLLGNGGHWFHGLNAAHAEDVDVAGALQGSPFAEKIGEYLAEAHEMLYETPKKRLSES